MKKYENAEPYITKDGSEIRELAHPEKDECRNQSLAEAVILPEKSTRPHKHLVTEEIYHITNGKGVMYLGNKKFNIQEKDTIVIKPNTPHFVINTGDTPLVILCSCSPAYSHEDTVIISCAGC